MPEAKCVNCGNRIHWRNQRGNRLADHRCKCGGSFRRYTYDDAVADECRATGQTRFADQCPECYYRGKHAATCSQAGVDIVARARS